MAEYKANGIALTLSLQIFCDIETSQVFCTRNHQKSLYDRISVINDLRHLRKHIWSPFKMLRLTSSLYLSLL